MQVRTIAEQAALAKLGTNDPEAIRGWDVFKVAEFAPEIALPGTFPVWDAVTLEQAKAYIISHYYMREIGLETVALWQYMVVQRLREEMPWVVDLANRLESMGDIFINDQHVRETQEDRSQGEKKEGYTSDGKTVTESREENKNGHRAETGTNNNQNLYSNTPQDGLQDVVEGRYLTEATVNKGDSNSEGDTFEKNTFYHHFTGEEDRSESSNVTLNRTDIGTLKEYGFVGNKVETIEQWMKAKIIIPKIMVESISDLFFGIL